MSSPVLFQALPPLSPEEYSELERSILDNGVMVPIVIDENNVVIDGHHRQRIARHHNLPCPSETKGRVHRHGEAQPRTLAESAPSASDPRAEACVGGGVDQGGSAVVGS